MSRTEIVILWLAINKAVNIVNEYLFISTRTPAVPRDLELCKKVLKKTFKALAVNVSQCEDHSSFLSLYIKLTEADERAMDGQIKVTAGVVSAG